ncbi:hypothetical protein DKX38_006337 [Salix brachista]|uniref:Uncharacterized protein n=1 Tax=Salix brachista TaxID=2182728 RepID=A0A5N5N1G8_9ROSI|nr:hypothetical protein DKX38_006337 [Salix brachista]
MIAGDSEMVQGSISSVLVDSMESNENRDALSPEDVAWADSCLVKDPEFQPESHDSSEPGSNDLPRGTGNLMHPSNEAENLQSRVVTDDEVSVIDKEIQTRSNGFPINEEIDEEDELIKQLNNALAENPAQSTPSSSDDPGAGKDLKEESLDTLIHGISDLSLDQHS